jgi:hypothetical protein
LALAILEGGPGFNWKEIKALLYWTWCGHYPFKSLIQAYIVYLKKVQDKDGDSWIGGCSTWNMIFIFTGIATGEL